MADTVIFKYFGEFTSDVRTGVETDLSYLSLLGMAGAVDKGCNRWNRVR